MQKFGGQNNKREEKAEDKVAAKIRFPRSHFEESIINEVESPKRKVGRPFKGDVEEFTKEPYVPERRSLLRGFKKFYSKKEFEDLMGTKTRILVN